MDNGTLHSSRRYNNEGGRATTNCFCWGNNLRCTVLESSARGGRLVHTNEKTGGNGNNKTKAGADDRCDDDEDIRGEYATYSKYNKKEAKNQGAMKINDDNIREIIEEVYRRDKFDKEFDIGLISECEEDGSNSEDEDSGEDSD